MHRVSMLQLSWTVLNYTDGSCNERVLIIKLKSKLKFIVDWMMGFYACNQGNSSFRIKNLLLGAYSNIHITNYNL